MDTNEKLSVTLINGRFVRHPQLKLERDKLRDAKRCINGPRDPERAAGRARGVVHGEVVRAGKCQRCLDVWEKTRA